MIDHDNSKSPDSSLSRGRFRWRVIALSIGCLCLLSVVAWQLLGVFRTAVTLDPPTRLLFDRALSRWERHIDSIKLLDTRVMTVERYGDEQYLFIFEGYHASGIICGYVTAHAADLAQGAGGIVNGPNLQQPGTACAEAEADIEIAHLRNLWQQTYGSPHVWRAR